MRKKYIIGWFLFVILMTFILYKVNAQALNAPLFGSETTPVLTDTITNADSIVTSRTVEFRMPISMKGGLTLSGEVKKLTGTAVNIDVTMRMLVDAATSKYGEVHTVGTITAPTDSLDWDFNIAGLSWWTGCDGYEVIFTEASAGTYTVQIEARGKSR